jgi:hypothetical protein
MPELNAFLDVAALKRENHTYRGSAGVSEGCREACFRPAFRDQATGMIYLSRYANGHVAAFHTLEGLPDEVIAARYTNGEVAKAKNTLISGFLKGGAFYTRQEAVDQVDTRRNRSQELLIVDPSIR